jgi:ABC-2 type transport system ATP-binding protein
MLEVRNLSVSFKNQKVLEDFNLNIQNGEILGLLGKNGAGKTTFFESLFQNVKFSGEIYWQNQNLKREQISYLETENYFYPYITGNEYLSYFSENDNFKKSELIEKFRLPLNKFVQDYSNTGKQLVETLRK